MPRFTVLMPTHNRADVVGYAIRSVLDQTEVDFELLVVGDGCTDGTSDLVRDFNDPRIVWFDLPKAPGFGYANRNIALREARGELIAYAPHDDLLFRDHLELLGEEIAMTGADWVHSRPLWVTPTGTIVPGFVNLAHDDELERFMTRANGIPAGTVVHRRDCFARFGFWPEDVERSGDWEVWRRFIRGGAAYRSVSVPTMLHFTADWRRALDKGSRTFKVFDRLATRKAWWPAGMRAVVRESEPEQAVVSEAMARGAQAWCDGIRADVDRVTQRLARDFLQFDKDSRQNGGAKEQS